jgi:DNA repair protein RadD
MTPLFSPPGALRPLRPHQETALENLRASLASGHRRPMLQAPTGFGKTLLAAHIVQRALDRGKRVAFTVTAISLIDQTVAAFEAEGIHAVGVIQGVHPRTDRDQPVQVCSVQTLARRRRLEVDLIIVDEGHELHKEIFRWMADSPDIPFIGLSATPWSRGLGKHYDDLVVAARTTELIDAGFLAPFKAFAPSEPDLAGVRTVAGDFHEGQLAEAVDKPALVGDVIETWLARGENRPTLCYGVNRAHAEHLQQRFIEVGVAAAYIDCFVDRIDRENIFERFRAGKTRVICNVATLAVGLDLPMCSCIIDARPTRSEIRFVQTIGRGLRTSPGKDKLIVLDHSGNHLRLGMVTDIHHECLDDCEARKPKAEAKERSEPLPRLCDECKAVLPAAEKVCSECGAVRIAKTDVKHRAGELVELGARRSGQREPEVWEKRRFFSELLSLRKPHYSARWPDAMFKEKFKHWPNGYDRSVAMEASIATRNWVRSRQIAFAKGRRAHG